MIPKNELRSGNWVFASVASFRGGGKTINGFDQIKRVINDGVVFSLSPLVPFNDLKEIPLISYSLHDAGFTQENQSDLWKWNQFKVNIQDSSVRYKDQKVADRVTSIHMLQNIVFDTSGEQLPFQLNRPIP
jgi:hypothetical protein